MVPAGRRDAAGGPPVRCCARPCHGRLQVGRVHSFLTVDNRENRHSIFITYQRPNTWVSRVEDIRSDVN